MNDLGAGKPAEGDKERIDRYRALLAGHMLRLEAGTHEDRDRVFTRVRALLLKKLTGEMKLDGSAVARELKAFDTAARQIEVAILEEEGQGGAKAPSKAPVRPAPAAAPVAPRAPVINRPAPAPTAPSAPAETAKIMPRPAVQKAPEPPSKPVAARAEPAATAPAASVVVPSRPQPAPSLATPPAESQEEEGAGQATGGRTKVLPVVIAIGGVLAVALVAWMLYSALSPANPPSEEPARQEAAAPTATPATPSQPQPVAPGDARPSVRVVETLRITPPAAQADSTFIAALAEDGLTPANVHIVVPGEEGVLATAEGRNTITLLRDGETPIARIESFGEVALSSGQTDGARIALPVDRSQAVSGRTIRVYIEARMPEGGAGDISVAYSAGALGNSGWQVFALSPEWRVMHFDYAVPEGERASASDVLAVRSGTAGGQGLVEIRMLGIAGRPQTP